VYDIHFYREEAIMKEKLVVNNLTEQAYELLRTKILNKEISPGTRLVSSTLAKEYGISRTPLRDAIRKLADDGLVTPSPTKGFFVFEPTVKDIEEIFEIRQILDIAGVTKLITEILPTHPEALEHITKSYESSLFPTNKSSTFVQSDEDFHASIIAMTGNSRLIGYYADLCSQTKFFRKLTSQNEQKMQQANEYHKKIYEGIKDMNLGLTISAIKSHIEYSREDAIQQLSSDTTEKTFSETTDGSFQ
jgi:DNA-binding GntR family transcriptional regulator